MVGIPREVGVVPGGGEGRMDLVSTEMLFTAWSMGQHISIA